MSKIKFVLISTFIVMFSSGKAFSQPTFGSAIDIAKGSVRGISALDVGDLNGDGFDDVFVAEGGRHAGGRKIFAWFESPRSIGGNWIRHNVNTSVSFKPFLGAAKLADMDNDGDLDIVMSADRHSGSTLRADIFIFFNPEQPSGRASDQWPFVKVVSDLALHHINDMEIADMDGDNKLDIIFRSLEPNQIHIYFQNTRSSYTSKVINTNISQSEGLAVGYIDDDNLPDITFTGYWLKSPSNPRRDNYSRRSIDSNFKNINQNTKESIGDIDGDGLNDVVIAPAETYRGGRNHHLAWYKNPGNHDSNNWQRNVIRQPINNIHTVKLGDMNNDGHLDVVTGIPWAADVVEQSIEIYYNNGDGIFNQSTRVATGKGLYSGAIADLDNDGDIDIIGQDTYSGNSRPFVYENQLNGTQTQNQAPVAQLSATPVSGLSPLGVTFDGSLSTDTDGTITHFLWQFGDGSNATGLYASHTYTVPGEYQVRLIVTDNNGAQSFATQTISVLANSSTRNPYAQIQAESFDDTRGVGIYPTASGNKIGSIQHDEWVAFYGLDFGDGAVSFHASTSSATNGGTIQLRTGSVQGTLVGTCLVSGTGSWESFVDVSCSTQGLSGVQDLYLVFTGNDRHLLDVDHFSFRANNSSNTTANPYNPIQAESFDDTRGVGIYPTASGNKIGSIQDDEWVAYYGLDFGGGAVSFHASTSSAMNGGTIELRTGSAQGTLVGTCLVSGTGSWESFVDVSCPTQGLSGVQDLYLVFSGNDRYLLDIDHFSFRQGSGVVNTANPYEHVEAERFDDTRGVGIYPTASGSKIGSIQDTNWVAYYDLDFGVGAVRFSARVSSRYNGGTIQLRTGGVEGQLVATCQVSGTGGWESFVDVSCPTQGLSGVQDLYLVFTGSSRYLLDIDFFVFNRN